MKVHQVTCRNWVFRNAGRAACGERVLIAAHGAFDSGVNFRQSCLEAKEASFTLNLTQGCCPEMKILLKTTENLM